MVSSGTEILLSCAIQRGTHPDQHLLCSSDELAGILLRGSPGSIEVDHLPQAVNAGLLQLSLRLDQATRS